MSFPSKTLLRFRPTADAEHYAAVVLAEGGNVLEVKRGGAVTRQLYSSVEEWLQSMEERPTMDQLEVSSSEGGQQEEKKEANEVKEVKGKKVKEVKEVKEKKVKLNLIPVSQNQPSILWTHHIHRMMKEAHPALLKDPQVIRAFNHLVEVLLSHQAHLYSFTPSSDSRYHTGILVDSEEALKNVCTIRENCIFLHEGSGRLVIRYSCGGERSKEESEFEHGIAKEIICAYQPLFEFIKDHVVPYMAGRDRTVKETTLRNRVLHASERMEHLQSRYEEELKRRQDQLHNFMGRHELMMDNYRRRIADMMTFHA